MPGAVRGRRAGAGPAPRGRGRDARRLTPGNRSQRIPEVSHAHAQDSPADPAGPRRWLAGPLPRGVGRPAGGRSPAGARPAGPDDRQGRDRYRHPGGGIMTDASKITASHRSRRCMVYVRQSTLAKTRANTESLERQYELAGRAVALGWSPGQVQVVDADLGLSGAQAANRGGFQELVAQVALGRVGLILGLEASRLARSNSDWYQLLDLCGMTDTLIADGDGIYDPAAYSDRLVLGLKGTLSEAELHLLKGRLIAGMRHKAAKGELRVALPAGLEYDQDGRPAVCADEAVREAIATVFRRFAELGSARQVMLSLLADGLELPRRRAGGRVVWAPASYGAVIGVLANPCYAGAFAFGRTRRATTARPRAPTSAAGPTARAWAAGRSSRPWSARCSPCWSRPRWPPPPKRSPTPAPPGPSGCEPSSWPPNGPATKPTAPAANTTPANRRTGWWPGRWRQPGRTGWPPSPGPRPRWPPSRPASPARCQPRRSTGSPGPGPTSGPSSRPPPPRPANASSSSAPCCPRSPSPWTGRPAPPRSRCPGKAGPSRNGPWHCPGPLRDGPAFPGQRERGGAGLPVHGEGDLGQQGADELLAFAGRGGGGLEDGPDVGPGPGEPVDLL